MEDKLVTLAIHTFEKAQILKTILESEGIEVYIQNVNLIQPTVSAGVRVRIKESDLPHALRVIENSKWLQDTIEMGEDKTLKRVLIPVDFSDYSLKACIVGFNYAASIGGEVALIHSYFSPFFPSAVPMGDTFSYGMTEEETIQSIFKRVKKEMDNLCAILDEKIKCGEIPAVKYSYVLREGLPEEEIVSYSKEYKPCLIVMGTRGKNQKEIDLIGTVTGEVIEMSKIPLLAIPENLSFSDIRQAKNYAFATGFDQRDIKAFDEFMSIVKDNNPNVYLFKMTTKDASISEKQLAAVEEYLRNIYPNVTISHVVFEGTDLLLSLERFVREYKIDVISLNVHKRNLFARMFNPSIARKMLFHTDTPMLVVHG